MGHNGAMGTRGGLPDCMMRYAGLLASGLLLAACASTPQPTRSVNPNLPDVDTSSAPRFAQGPIAAACTVHNRRNANAERCGCIQAAANLTLSQAEQQRAVRFFAEPELLQTIKLSDTPANEEFWYRWERFAETAERMCN